MDPIVIASRHAHPAWRLVRALWWRTRHEGVGAALVVLVPFTVVMGLMLGVSSLIPAAINGAPHFAAMGARYGAHADALSIGLAMMMGPGLEAVFAAVAVAALVKNLVGAESTRGTIEILLAGPYGPRDVMLGFLLYTAGFATLYWLGFSLIAAGAIGAVAAANGVALVLTTPYLLASLMLPLLASWAAASLSLTVMLLYPRLTQVGGFGLQMGAGNLAGAPALAPALAVLVLFVGGWSVRLGPVLALSLTAVAGVTIASTGIVAHRFRPERILE